MNRLMIEIANVNNQYVFDSYRVAECYRSIGIYCGKTLNIPMVRCVF